VRGADVLMRQASDESDLDRIDPEPGTGNAAPVVATVRVRDRSRGVQGDLGPRANNFYMSNTLPGQPTVLRDEFASRVDIILNSGSGKLDKQALATTMARFFAERHIDARIHLTQNGRELIAASQQAAAADAGIVVAGGGDGTIATVAHHLVSSDKLLGILPLGTFNYFAKDLGLPLELEEALEVIVGGRSTSVDVGDVNGHIFLNNSSIGLYPALLRKRESTYRRFGRSQVAAYLAVVLVLLEPPAFVNLTVTADGQRLSRRTPLLFIGVNSHQLEDLGIPARECLAARQLTLFITRQMGPLALGRLGLRALCRGLEGATEFEAVCASEIDIGVRRRRVRVALDGEVRVIETPLRFRMMRDALRVVVPHHRHSPSD
jgi:diacylglycerol kinase family enzyme